MEVLILIDSMAQPIVLSIYVKSSVDPCEAIAALFYKHKTSLNESTQLMQAGILFAL